MDILFSISYLGCICWDALSLFLGYVLLSSRIKGNKDFNGFGCCSFRGFRYSCRLNKLSLWTSRPGALDWAVPRMRFSFLSFLTFIGVIALSQILEMTLDSFFPLCITHLGLFLPLIHRKTCAILVDVLSRLRFSGINFYWKYCIRHCSWAGGLWPIIL